MPQPSVTCRLCVFAATSVPSERISASVTLTCFWICPEHRSVAFASSLKSEKRREGDLSLLTKKLWISVLRHKTTGIIEVNSAVLFLTGARESQNQNKECRTALNYSKLQPFMFLIHTHVTTTKQTQYIGKTLILTSGWYHCIIMQNEKREKR